jgi:hypothetical protein
MRQWRQGLPQIRKSLNQSNLHGCFSVAPATRRQFADNGRAAVNSKRRVVVADSDRHELHTLTYCAGSQYKSDHLGRLRHFPPDKSLAIGGGLSGYLVWREFSGDKPCRFEIEFVLVAGQPLPLRYRYIHN